MAERGIDPMTRKPIAIIEKNQREDTRVAHRHFENSEPELGGLYRPSPRLADWGASAPRPASR